MGRTISIYLIRAILPYFLFSWLLLSVILFVQQAHRFSDIFFNANIPAGLVWQLAVALIPNVIAFTCPAAMLVGVVIGLAKMQTDSELVAIRATGFGNLQVAAPIALVGVACSVLAFIVNLEGVPLAASIVRQVAIQTAVKKLESPIEPGVFEREVSGYTMFVRDGDVDTGQWRHIFIYNEGAGKVRLITSENGRIDVSGQQSELVLNDAVVTTLPAAPGGTYSSENLGEIRLAVRTSRGELIDRLGKGGSLEELGLTQLASYAATSEGRERIEAQIIWQRRILLSLSPLIFSLVGTTMVLRFNRGGRGLGALLALLALIGFYLTAFLGEQLARTGYIPVLLGGLLPVAASVAAIAWFGLSGRAGLWNVSTAPLARLADGFRSAPTRMQTRNLFVDMTTGLRDLDVALNLIKYFLLALCFLIAVFVTFTAFDIWKFAGTIDGGVGLLTKYLLYLLPYTYIQLSPSAAMIAILATYVIKSRQNEVVTWTAAGQSVYRLLLPCFLVAVLLGAVNWLVQERLLPETNRRQDDLRSFLRSGGAAPELLIGRRWSAVGNYIVAFMPASDGKLASDNEKRSLPRDSAVGDVAVFEFGEDKTNLQTVYRARSAGWKDGKVFADGTIEKIDITAAGTVATSINRLSLDVREDPFAIVRNKPGQLTASETRQRLAYVDSDAEKRIFGIALEKKYTILVLPLVVALFTAPFALSLSRKGNVVTVGCALGLWLLFTGLSSVSEQLGLNGYLSPSLAVWPPLVIFALLGIYLLSKVRT